MVGENWLFLNCYIEKNLNILYINNKYLQIFRQQIIPIDIREQVPSIFHIYRIMTRSFL